MTAPPEIATVLDTTALSNFAHVNDVELLLGLPRLVTVDAVRDELTAGAETHFYLENAVTVLGEEITVLSPSPTATEVEQELLESLDPGEAQAIAVAEVAEGMIVTDDGDARTIAQQRGVEITGSIGLLVRFVENNQITAETADVYLKRWIDEAGFRSPARDFDVFLEK